jgi:hypothetical protein
MAIPNRRNSHDRNDYNQSQGHGGPQRFKHGLTARFAIAHVNPAFIENEARQPD